MDNEANLKRGFTNYINVLKQDPSKKEVVKLMLMIRDRINVCSHCNGETSDSGKCIDSLA